MESAILAAVVALLVAAGLYLAFKKHPTDPHHEFMMELTRHCLPRETDGLNEADSLSQPELLEPHEEALRSRHLI